MGVETPVAYEGDVQESQDHPLMSECEDIHEQQVLYEYDLLNATRCTEHFVGRHFME